MAVQAIVDRDYLFRDISVRWPGSIHDARVFVNSLIFKRITDDNILAGMDCTLCGSRGSVCIVGVSAHPLQTWLMKPFIDSPSLPVQQQCFNYHLSRARTVVENTFGRLKARWRRLLKRNDMTPDNIPSIIAVCCILHNLCEIHRDGFNDAWLEEDMEHPRTYRNMEHPQPILSIYPTTGSGVAQSIRESFVDYLYQLYGPCN